MARCRCATRDGSSAAVRSAPSFKVRRDSIQEVKHAWNAAGFRAISRRPIVSCDGMPCGSGIRFRSRTHQLVAKAKLLRQPKAPKVRARPATRSVSATALCRWPAALSPSPVRQPTITSHAVRMILIRSPAEDATL